MDKTLLQRFFDGQATQGERKRFMEWIHSEASELEVGQEVERYFKGNVGQTFLWDDEGVLKKVQSGITALEPGGHQGQSTTEKSMPLSHGQKHGHSEDQVTRPNLPRFIKVAAMLFLVATISILIWRSHENNEAPSPPTEIAELTKSTGQGQKLSFYLDDGSKVMLNAGSKITFPSKFTGDERKVSLEGEAYFEVVKNASKPFIVASGNYVTKVLGTSFVVDADTCSGHITIGLRSGKVKVEKASGQGMDDYAAVLKPGEMLTVDLKTKRETISAFEDVAMFGWTDGILYFKDASFKQVTGQLAKWYDVRFAVNYPKHIDKKYSGKYVNETLDNVLKGLSFVDDFDYSIDGKNVTIKFRKP